MSSCRTPGTDRRLPARSDQDEVGISLLLNLEPDEAIHDFSAGNIEVLTVLLEKLVEETLGGRNALQVDVNE